MSPPLYVVWSFIFEFLFFEPSLLDGFTHLNLLMEQSILVGASCNLLLTFCLVDSSIINLHPSFHIVLKLLIIWVPWGTCQYLISNPSFIFSRSWNIFNNFIHKSMKTCFSTITGHTDRKRSSFQQYVKKGSDTNYDNIDSFESVWSSFREEKNDECGLMEHEIRIAQV